MKRFRAVSLVALGVLVIGLASVALGVKEQPRPLEPPDDAVGRLPVSGPFVILQQGDTSWVQVHTDTLRLPLTQPDTREPSSCRRLENVPMSLSAFPLLVVRRGQQMQKGTLAGLR